jgi:hypothetical protein
MYPNATLSKHNPSRTAGKPLRYRESSSNDHDEQAGLAKASAPIACNTKAPAPVSRPAKGKGPARPAARAAGQVQAKTTGGGTTGSANATKTKATKTARLDDDGASADDSSSADSPDGGASMDDVGLDGNTNTDDGDDDDDVVDGHEDEDAAVLDGDDDDVDGDDDGDGDGDYDFGIHVPKHSAHFVLDKEVLGSCLRNEKLSREMVVLLRRLVQANEKQNGVGRTDGRLKPGEMLQIGVRDMLL